MQPTAATMVVWLLAANITLAVFNMIPAFPLDGGRVLRAILAMIMGFPKATRVTAAISQIIAVALGIFAILNGQILLTLVAFFIFLGAGREQAAEQARRVLTALQNLEICPSPTPLAGQVFCSSLVFSSTWGHGGLTRNGSSQDHQ